MASITRYSSTETANFISGARVQNTGKSPLTSVVGRRTWAMIWVGSTSASRCKLPARALRVAASGAEASVNSAGLSACHRSGPTAAATSARLHAHATCKATASSPLAPAVSVKCRSSSAQKEKRWPAVLDSACQSCQNERFAARCNLVLALVMSASAICPACSESYFVDSER